MNRKSFNELLRKPAMMISLGIFLLIIISCIIFPLIGYDDYATLDLEHQYAPVSIQYPFSTDNLGRNLFNRIMYGGRYTLGLSLLATVLTMTFGTVIGMISGYKGGLMDEIITSIAHVVSSIPYLLIVIMVEVMLGWGKGYYALAVAITNLPAVIQVVRASTLKISNLGFIEASRIGGKSDFYILSRHIFRNIYSTVLVQFCSTYGKSIVACSILGYLEIGISSPTPEWGRMVADYFHLIQSHGYLVIIPCVFISISVLCMTIMSHELRDALDPKEASHE